MPGKEQSVQRKLVKEYIAKFPNTPNLTLAKTIYKEMPNMFKDVEHIRSMIRMTKGQKGEANRKDTKEKHLFTKPGSRDPWANMPESHADSFEPYVINQSKTLIISDLHIPYHDVKAIKTALQYGLDKDVNCILINGDLLDFALISRHERDWRQRMPHEEFEAARKFLVMLRELFPTAKIVFKEGNHDERWEKWLFVKAPELFGDPEFKIETRLRLAELKIDIVKDKRLVELGKLTVLHGHEMFGGSGGVNPARATFLKTLDSVLVGHYHKRSVHDEPTLSGRLISVNSIGCLCGLTPHYMPINKWSHGFGYVELDVKSGEYVLHNMKIINGKVY